MSRQINPFEDNPYLELGRFLQEHSYQREKKSIRLEDMEIDFLKKEDGQVVVGEVKKSSRAEKSATMQLAFYLRFLRDYGIEARGELSFPKEKKRVMVNLNSETLQELEEAERAIEEILSLKKPPPEKWVGFCKNCAYREFCWA